MSRVVSAAVFIALLLTTGPAFSDPTSYPVFEKVIQDPTAHFSYWSSVLKTGTNTAEIGYAVCNLDKKTPLIFKWNGPNIALAPGGRLPIGKCSIDDRTVSAFETDMSASILYTQAASQHQAPAYVTKLVLPVPIPVSLLPHSLVNRLRTFYAEDQNQTDQPSQADLYIEQTRSDNLVTHVISWSPPSVSVAISTNAFGRSPEVVLKNIEALGYQARLSPLEKEVNDPSTLAPDRLSSNVLIIDNAGATTGPIALTLEGSATALGRSYVSLIDRAHNALIIDSEITSFEVK